MKKTYKGDFYSINSIFGNDWATFFILLGGRECGKSYSVMKWLANRKVKKQDKLKVYWMRLTDQACANLLSQNGDKLIDPDIKRKYDLHVTRKANTIFTYDEVTRTTRKGEEITEKKNLKEFATVLSCSTFYNTKGVGYFDADYNGEYLLVLDEMNREDSERNSFDIVYNFANLCENLIRSTKLNLKIVMIGNTLDEASDLLSAFNFIPNEFGRYKLKSKKCVVDYIAPNDKYLQRRKGSVANILMPNASTFTNEVQIDRSLLVNKRKCIKPKYIIKFGKYANTWYTVWNDNIIKPYKYEELNNVIPMIRYLDEVYYKERADAVRRTFDNRLFYYTDISTFKKFQKHLKTVK